MYAKRNHHFSGIAISITYSERVFVTLIIQHARRVLRSIFSSVTSAALQHVSTSSHEGYDLKKKLNLKYVF